MSIPGQKRTDVTVEQAKWSPLDTIEGVIIKHSPTATRVTQTDAVAHMA